MIPEDAFDPIVGEPEEIGSDLRRIVAPNPSPMTFRGTNTYLLGRRDVAVIDPGPDDPAHLEAILGALGPGQRVSHILITHAHLDHSGLASRLAAATGAPVMAFGDADAGRSDMMQDLAKAGLVGGGEGVDAAFVPDVSLRDGEEIGGDGWRLTAHWTPGHFGNHMSFAVNDVVFTGDLVMGWASSLVSPPDGDLTDFMASCRRLQALAARYHLSGHGAPIVCPQARLQWLLDHRLAREAAIRTHLAEGGLTASDLTARIYTDTSKRLWPAAERNVLAHLIDLHKRGIAHPDDTLTASARFRLADMGDGSGKM